MEIHMENQVKNGKSNGKAAAQTVVYWDYIGSISAVESWKTTMKKHIETEADTGVSQAHVRFRARG